MSAQGALFVSFGKLRQLADTGLTRPKGFTFCVNQAGLCPGRRSISYFVT